MNVHIVLNFPTGSTYVIPDCARCVLWENVLLCARDAVQAHFKKQGITGMGKTARWLLLQARGLPIAVDPDSNIDLEAIPPPNNPLGNRH